jgi:hypothetical protein
MGSNAGGTHGRIFRLSSEAEDPRNDNARHDLFELLVIALCAVLCGAEDCPDMALFGRAKEAFFRVFRPLDPVKFHACVLVFMRSLSEMPRPRGRPSPPA